MSEEEEEEAEDFLTPHQARMQWFEAAIQVHDKQTVAQMQSREFVDYFPCYDMTGLHLAARFDHDLVAAQLLVDDPSLAYATDLDDLDALCIAAMHGSEKVVAVLLANHVMDDDGMAALRFAACGGHEKVVAQLLAADPKLLSPANDNDNDDDGRHPIHSAACEGHEVVVDMLLAACPQLIFDVKDGTTVLHSACVRAGSRAFFTRLLALNPGALRAKNSHSETPFQIAIRNDNDNAIEVLQWKLTFDEIVDTFTKHKKSYVERLGPIVEGQCACLVESLLNRDVVGIVFEYLGLTCQETKQKKQKRAKLA